MRRALLLSGLLAACTPAEQQLAREGTMAALQCAGLRAARQLEPTVDGILRGESWRGELAALGARAGLDLVDCAVASVLRTLGAEHKAAVAEVAEVAAVAPPAQTERERAAERARLWLRGRGREVAL